MAIRNIRLEGDPVLRKKSRKVDKIDDRIITLLDDMAETMKQEEGVGLAAPQVGVLRAVILVDVGDGLIELINPQLLEAEGKEIKAEGCLSIPDRSGEVERPYWVKVKGLDRKGEEVVITGEGLLARALCHEIDHLEGILFIDKVIPESR
ncbi:MAG: peptide deformylase [Firmicutes bacterium]|jgi:peptide deformylase|nr:peptide deformylase [Bacillota bacterium]MDD3298871.1 peptide deformylase [Bacillota bacterium]MDD3850966.1 peptide deformylase [Bacillota bacterium]